MGVSSHSSGRVFMAGGTVFMVAWVLHSRQAQGSACVVIGFSIMLNGLLGVIGVVFSTRVGHAP
jgi:hypothetical protein